MGRSVPGEGTREEGLGQDRPAHPGRLTWKGVVGQSLARGGQGIRTPFSSNTPIPPLSLVLAPTMQCEGNRPASTSTRDPVRAQSDFLVLTQNFFSPRPPKPFSEDSLSVVPSPPYLVCFPSSPPPGQPGKHRCRHLGSGRWGRSLTSRGVASGEPGAGALPPPSLPVLSW